MDLSFPLAALTILLALTLSLTLFLHKSKTRQNSNLPPGSFGLPFIGETYEFLYGKPEKFINHRMQKYSPKIFKTKVYGEPTAVLCGTAGNKFLAANEDKLFTSWRPYPSQTFFRSTYQTATSATIPRQTEVHYFRAPGFLRPEALMRSLDTMNEMIQQHITTSWRNKPNVKVYKLAQLMTATLSARLYLGLEDHARIAKLAGLLDGMTMGLHSVSVDFPGTIFWRAKRAAEAIREEILVIIEEKKAATLLGTSMGGDILSHMIVSSDPVTGRVLPENEVADKVMGLLVAGFSTPATALTFVMKFIGERPEIYDKIQEEQMEISRSKTSEALNWDDLQKMKYTWNIALEVMRLVPPFQGTFREAITDITYEGFTIPKGWKIYWTVSTTNKDPKHFPDPEEFVATRFEEANVPPPYTNVPFGGGPRICPGKEYARLVLLTFLHHIVKRMRWEVMYPKEKIIGNVIPTPARGLPVRLHHHAVSIN